MRNTFGFNVTCFMVLVCIVLGHGVSAAYAPNMGNQGTSVHNNHHLRQENNVFDVPFVQNNVNNNQLQNSSLLGAWDEQGDMQQENDLLSLPTLIKPLSFFPNELPSISSLHSNGLNNNEPLNDQASMVWDQPSICLNPSPCFTQLTATPFYPSLENSYNNPLIQQSNLNHGQQPNNGLFNDGSSTGWNNNAPTDFNVSPCFTQPMTVPSYGSLAKNNYNEPPIQNNLNNYQDFNTPPLTFRSQEQQCIGLQEKRILTTPYLCTPADLTTIIENEVTNDVNVNALLPMVSTSSQRKKRKVTLQTPHKSESVPFTQKNNIALPQRSQSVTPQAVHNTKKGDLTCYLCRKPFSKKSSLTRHIKSVHFNEKPYKCPHCGKRFAENFNLKRHVRTHTGEKSHPCLVCKKSFTRNDSLKKHVEEFHTKNKSFVCVICEKSYKKKVHLIRHMKSTHFKENHECPKCNKSFTRRDGLKKHIENIHLKKKRYECSQCKRKFTELGSLKRHMRTVHNHNQEKRFKCDFCNKQYKQKHNLKTHMKKKHSDVS